MHIDTDGRILAKMKRVNGDVLSGDGETEATDTDDIKEWLATHSIDQRMANGLTLLQAAVKDSSYNTTLFLLNEGAGWGVKHPSTGDTALHFATHHANPRILKLLLERGTPCCDSENSSGDTPLSLLLNAYLMLQRSDEPLNHELDQKFCILNQILNRTAADTVSRIITKLIKNNSPAGIQVLLEAATSSSDNELVQLIVKILENSGKNIVNSEGAIGIAIKKGDLSMLHIFTSSTLLSDHDRSETLAKALQYGNTSVVALLRQQQAKQQSGHRVSRTTSSSSKRPSSAQEASFLSAPLEYAQHAIISQLYNFVAEGAPQKINSLLATVKADGRALGNASCTPVGTERYTILTTLYLRGNRMSRVCDSEFSIDGVSASSLIDAYLASFVSLIAVSEPAAIDQLLSECEIEDINTEKFFGQCLLFSASASGNYSVVKHIINKGADINLSGPQQATPLHTAVQNHCEDIVSLLLSEGADSSLVNAFGESPLTFSLSEPDFISEPIVYLLLDHSSSDTVRECMDSSEFDDIGQILLRYAIQNSSVDVVRMLTQEMKIPLNRDLIVLNRTAPLYFQECSQVVKTPERRGSIMSRGYSSKSLSGSMPQLLSGSPHGGSITDDSCSEYTASLNNTNPNPTQVNHESDKSPCSPLLFSMIGTIPDHDLEGKSESDRISVITFLLSIGAHLSQSECETVAAQLDDKSATAVVTSSIQQNFKEEVNRRKLAQKLSNCGSIIAAAAVLGGFDCSVGRVLQECSKEGTVTFSDVIYQLSPSSLFHYLAVIGLDNVNALYPITVDGTLQFLSLPQIIISLNYSYTDRGSDVLEECVSTLLEFGADFTAAETLQLAVSTLPYVIVEKILAASTNVQDAVSVIVFIIKSSIMTESEKGLCCVSLLRSVEGSVLQNISEDQRRSIFECITSAAGCCGVGKIAAGLVKFLLSTQPSKEFLLDALKHNSSNTDVINVIISFGVSRRLLTSEDIKSVKHTCLSPPKLSASFSDAEPRTIIISDENEDGSEMVKMRLPFLETLLQSLGQPEYFGEAEINVNKRYEQSSSVVTCVIELVKSLFVKRADKIKSSQHQQSVQSWIANESTNLIVVHGVETNFTEIGLTVLREVCEQPNSLIFELSIQDVDITKKPNFYSHLFAFFENPIEISNEIALNHNTIFVIIRGGEHEAISRCVKYWKSHPVTLLEEKCRFIWMSEVRPQSLADGESVICIEDDVVRSEANSQELVDVALSGSDISVGTLCSNTLQQLTMNSNSEIVFKEKTLHSKLVAQKIVSDTVRNGNQNLLHNPPSILLTECIRLASLQLYPKSCFDSFATCLTSEELCGKSRGGYLSLLAASRYSLDTVVLNDLTFELANLANTTITGVSFRNCVFLDCIFTNCTFICCDITSAVFLPQSVDCPTPRFVKCENLSVAPAIQLCAGVSRESLNPECEVEEKDTNTKNRTHATLTPDKQFVCVPSENGVEIWEIESGRKWEGIPTSGKIDSLVAHDLGSGTSHRNAVILSISGCIEVWELASRPTQHHAKCHHEKTPYTTIPCMVVINGILYYSASDKADSINVNKFKMRPTGKLLSIRGTSSIPTYHSNPIGEMHLSSATNSIVTLGTDGIVNVVNTLTESCLLLEPKLGSKSEFRCVAVVGCFILIAHNDHLKVWHYAADRSSLTLVDHERYTSSITQVAAAVTGSHYVVCLEDDIVILTDYTCGRRVPLIGIPTTSDSAISVFQSGEIAVVCSPSEIQIRTVPQGVLRTSISRTSKYYRQSSRVSVCSLQRTENLLSTESYLKSASLGYSHAAYKLLTKSTLNHNERVKLVESLPTTSQKRVAKGKLRKDEADTRKCFELAINIDSEKNCPSARIELGKLSLVKVEEKRRLFREAIEIEKNNSDAYLELANTLKPTETTELPNCKERFSKIDLVRIAIARNPLDPKPYFELAVMIGTKPTITLFSNLTSGNKSARIVTKQELLNQVLMLDINLELYLVLEERGIEDDILLPHYRDAYLAMLEEGFRENCREGIRKEDVETVREAMSKQANRYHRHPDRYPSHFRNIKQHFEDALSLAKRRPLTLSNGHYLIAFYILGYLSDADREQAVIELSEFAANFSNDILFGDDGHSALILIQHYSPQLHIVIDAKTPLQHAAHKGWHQVCFVLQRLTSYLQYEDTAGGASALFYALTASKKAHPGAVASYIETISVLCTCPVIPLRYIRESVNEELVDEPVTEYGHTLLYFLLIGSCDEAVVKVLKLGSDLGKSVFLRDGKEEPLVVLALRDRHTKALENRHVEPLLPNTIMALLESSVLKSNLDLCTFIWTTFKTTLGTFEYSAVASPVETALKERKPAPLCLFLVQSLPKLLPPAAESLQLVVDHLRHCGDGSEICADYHSLVKEIHNRNRLNTNDAEATALLRTTIVEYADAQNKPFVPMTIAVGVRDAGLVMALQQTVSQSSFSPWMTEEVLAGGSLGDLSDDIADEEFKVTDEQWLDINFALSYFAAFHSTDPPEDCYPRADKRYRTFLVRLSMDRSYPKLLFGSSHVNAQFLKEVAMVNLDSFSFSSDGYTTLLTSSIEQSQWDKLRYLITIVDCNLITSNGGALSVLFRQRHTCEESTYQLMLDLIIKNCNRIVLDDLLTHHAKEHTQKQQHMLAKSIVKLGNFSMTEALIMDYDYDPKMDVADADQNLFLVGWKEHVSIHEGVDDGSLRPAPTRLKVILWLFFNQIAKGTKPHESVSTILKELQPEYLGDYQNWFQSSIQHLLWVFTMCDNTAVVSNLLPSYMGSAAQLSQRLFTLAIEHQSIAVSLFLLSALNESGVDDAVKLYTQDHATLLKGCLEEGILNINEPASGSKTLLEIAVENGNTMLATICMEMGAVASVRTAQVAVTNKMLIEAKLMLADIALDTLDEFESTALSDSTDTLLVSLCYASQTVSAQSHPTQKLLIDTISAIIMQVLQCPVWRDQFKQLVTELHQLTHQLVRSSSGRHLQDFDKLPPIQPNIPAYTSRDQCIELRRLHQLREDYDPTFRAMYTKISDKVTSMIEHDAFEDWAPSLISTGYIDGIEMLHACVITAKNIFENISYNSEIVESTRFRLNEFKRRLPRSITVANILSTGYTELLADLGVVPPGVKSQAIAFEDLPIYTHVVADNDTEAPPRPSKFIKTVPSQSTMLVLDTAPSDPFIQVIQDGVTGWVSKSSVNIIPLHVYDKTVMRVQSVLSDISPPIPIHSCFAQTIKKGAITYDYILVLQPILRKGDGPKDRVINQCSKQIRELINKKWVESGEGNLFICGIGTGQTGGNTYCSAEVSRLLGDAHKQHVDREQHAKVASSLRQLLYIERLCNMVTTGNSEEGNEVTIGGDVHLKLLGLKNQAIENYKAVYADLYKQTERLLTAPDHDGVVCAIPLQIPPRPGIKDQVIDVDTLTCSRTSPLVIRSGPSRIHPHLATIDVGASIRIVKDYCFTGGRGSSEENWYYVVSSTPTAMVAERNIGRHGVTKKGDVEGFVLFNELKSIFEAPEDADTPTAQPSNGIEQESSFSLAERQQDLMQAPHGITHQAIFLRETPLFISETSDRVIPCVGKQWAPALVLRDTEGSSRVCVLSHYKSPVKYQGWANRSDIRVLRLPFIDDACRQILRKLDASRTQNPLLENFVIHSAFKLHNSKLCFIVMPNFRQKGDQVTHMYPKINKGWEKVIEGEAIEVRTYHENEHRISEAFEKAGLASRRENDNSESGIENVKHRLTTYVEGFGEVANMVRGCCSLDPTDALDAIRKLVFDIEEKYPSTQLDLPEQDDGLGRVCYDPMGMEVCNIDSPAGVKLVTLELFQPTPIYDRPSNVTFPRGVLPEHTTVYLQQKKSYLSNADNLDELWGFVRAIDLPQRLNQSVNTDNTVTGWIDLAKIANSEVKDQVRDIDSRLLNKKLLGAVTDRRGNAHVNGGKTAKQAPPVTPEIPTVEPTLGDNPGCSQPIVTMSSPEQNQQLHQAPHHPIPRSPSKHVKQQQQPVQQLLLDDPEDSRRAHFGVAMRNQKNTYPAPISRK